MCVLSVQLMYHGIPRQRHVLCYTKYEYFLSVCFAVCVKRIRRLLGKCFTSWTRGTASRRANKGCSLYGMRQLHYWR